MSGVSMIFVSFNHGGYVVTHFYFVIRTTVVKTTQHLDEDHEDGLNML